MNGITLMETCPHCNTTLLRSFEDRRSKPNGRRFRITRRRREDRTLSFGEWKHYPGFYYDTHNSVRADRRDRLKDDRRKNLGRRDKETLSL